MRKSKPINYIIGMIYLKKSYGRKTMQHEPSDKSCATCKNFVQYYRKFEDVPPVSAFVKVNCGHCNKVCDSLRNKIRLNCVKWQAIPPKNNPATKELIYLIIKHINDRLTELCLFINDDN